MPGNKIHQFFGVAVGLVLAYVFYYFGLLSLSLLNALIVLVIVLFYSILPDIDISSSKARHYVTVIFLSFILLSLIFKKTEIALILTIFLLILQFIDHRTFIHTVVAGLLFSFPLLFYNYVFFIIAFISFVSHLALDGKVKLV